ncbi:putative aminopeptidase npepl1 [Clydaea vesicula]|uniref:Aminopeptidase npepl1 n=1 Tax=Clydaea vesicula TaxID=447962 RepID=A0AAD5U966_9FUNG|nr:putative aminopeptidase npepl1 [Clydaea vesicula]
MGGSAAVLGAFQSYVLLSKSEEKPLNLYALLCMADNAISSKSQRPDDIVDMYSGKTVELNNTDAEGRLVLADGVAYATKHFAPDVVLDIATLTGAVLVTTGKKHAGILCNDIDLENTLVNSGRNTGNLEERRFRERRRKEYSAEIENATFSEKNEFKRNRKRTSHKIGNNNGGNKKQKRYVSLKKLV